MDGFGIFHNVTVDDVPPGLSLFLGNNEAGKSTTLSFVHTILFGYLDGRSKDKFYPPLQGGDPGGAAGTGPQPPQPVVQIDGDVSAALRGGGWTDRVSVGH